MRYFKTKHQQYSARLTAVIMLLLVLLLFVVGPGYMDPPLEYGVAINFGSSDTGSGMVQPKEALASESTPVTEPIEEIEIVPTDESSESAASEEVLNSEDLESIAFKNTQAEKAKLEVEANEQEKAEANVELDRLKKEADLKAKKKAQLDALMGGIGADQGTDKGSEGDDESAGDKGQLDGKPYASSYFGSSGSGNGGVGYGLNDRGRPKRTKVIPECDEEGKVVVKIYVNQNGSVIKAIPGEKGTIGDSCLYDAARKTALSHKWPADPKAPLKQIGFVIVDFTVRQ